MTYNHTAVRKDLDERHYTHGGGQIRIETWIDVQTLGVVKYNLAYANPTVSAKDNGRIIGFDNDHLYPGFATPHHCHWNGIVFENPKYHDFDTTLARFERHLKRLRRRLKSAY